MNKTLKSITSLLITFENSADFQQIMKSKPCVFTHISEIEIQTKCAIDIYFHCYNMI